MAISVKLYGDLREKVPFQNYSNGIPENLKLEKEDVKLVFDILTILNIKEGEISHIFVNGTYCGPGKKLKDGDRVGLFPRRMGLMFLEITQKKLITVNIQAFVDLERYGRINAKMDLPEGSTIKSIFNKLKITGNELVIRVNGITINDEDFIISDNDNIEISNSKEKIR